MLSYDTRKLDIPDSNATKVPEDAGMAAREPKPISYNQSRFTMNSLRSCRPVQDNYIKETSDAIMKSIPEVLMEPYHITLPEERLSPIDKRENHLIHNEARSNVAESQELRGSVVNQELGYGEVKRMTRMEYIQYVREQCDKELSFYTPITSQSQSQVKSQAQISLDEPILTKNTETVEDELPVIEFDDKEKEMPLFTKDNLELHKVTLDDILPVKENPKVTGKKQFLNLLLIRGLIALCLFIGIISFDLLGVHFGHTDVREIKEIVGSNKTIEKIEKTVSDFTKDTVLPVFGIDHEEDK